MKALTRRAISTHFALRNNFDHGKMFFFIRQYYRAIDQLNKTLELEPIPGRA